MKDEFTDVGMRQAVSAVLATTAVAWAIQPNEQRRGTPGTKGCGEQKKSKADRAVMAEVRRVVPEPPRTLHPQMRTA